MEGNSAWNGMLLASFLVVHYKVAPYNAKSAVASKSYTL